MKKFLLILMTCALALGLYAQPAGDAQPCPGTTTVTDYDGNVYNTVRIGNQCWMKQNLRTKHFANGGVINAGGSNTSTTAYYYYEVNTSSISLANRGYYYNWPAAMHGAASSSSNPSGVQGVCPTGWHLPSGAEWDQLFNYVRGQSAYRCSGTNTIGKSLASTSNWHVCGDTLPCVPGYNQTSNNATGFSAYPMNSHGLALSIDAHFQSSQAGSTYCGVYGIQYNSSTWYSGSAYKYSGVPVRCLRNNPILTVNTWSVDSTIHPTWASCGGSVATYNDGISITARGLCWSTSHNPTIADAHTTGSGTGSFNANITGLTPNTTYYVRAYATPSQGVTMYGEEVSFTTPAFRNPTVTTSSVTNIGSVSATCGGTIVDSYNDGINVTARGVCWSTSSSPTVSNSHTTNGTGTGSFTSNITGLTPNTTYYVRAYATTSNGTVYGSQKSFRPECKINVSISGNTTIYAGESSTLTASVTGTDGCTFAWSAGAGYTQSTITVSPAATTTYTVTVTERVSNCTATAHAMVTVNPVCRSCPDYNWDLRMSASGLYTIMRDSIEVSGGCLTYKIENVSNQYKYTFETGGAGSASFDTRLYLYNDSCNQVAYNDDYSGYGRQSRIVFTPTVSGTYYLKVDGYNGASGSFSLAAKKECPTPLVITGDTVVRIGHSTTLTASGTGPYMWSDTSTGNSITVSPTTTTTYSVWGFDECGDYRQASVTVTVLPICQSCPDYDEEMAINGADVWTYKSDNTEVAYGCRTYKVYCSNQYKYTFETGGAGTADFDTRLYLYNDSCSQVASNDDYAEYGTRSRIVFTPTVSGTYYLKVGGYNNRYGSFTLAAKRNNVPVVSTDSVTNISMTTATCGGNVTEEGYSAVTARGVCWSLRQQPTVTDAHTSDGTGTGAFTSSITGLLSGVTYYVRAYATNSKGTAYGEEVSFSTPCPGDQCELTFVLTDNYGDGWNGNAIQVTDAETGTVLATLTNEDLDGLMGYEENEDDDDDDDDEAKDDTYPYMETQTITMPICNGRSIYFKWVAGNYAEETSYSVYDGNGELVFSGAGGFSDSIGHTVRCCNIELDGQYTYYEDFESYTSSTTASTGVEPTCWELVRADVTMTDANRPQLYYRSDFAHSGNYSLRLGNRGVYAMPGLAMGTPLNELRLEMYLRQPYTNHQLEVGVWETDGSFVPVATFNNSTANVEPVACDFSGYTGNGRRIAFRNTLNDGTNTNYSYNYLDDIVLRRMPVNDAKPCPNVPTVTDIDGNVYNTVQLGEQCWMKENMRTTHYADGVEISSGSRHAPNNDTSTVATYGYLYDWSTVMHGAYGSVTNPSGVQGICPDGWHLPSDAEWGQLESYVGSVPAYGCGNDNTAIARALSASTGWLSNDVESECAPGYNPGKNNLTGFGVLPAGYYSSWSAQNYGYGTDFWTTSDNPDRGTALVYGFGSSSDGTGGSSLYKYYSLSVRCVLGDGGSVPVVHTGSVVMTSDSTAICAGEVIGDDGQDVLARGICWDRYSSPTISGSHTEEGVGLGSFTSTLTGLTPGTRYYVRAYAINATGVAYGEMNFFVVPDCHPIPYLPYSERFENYTGTTTAATGVEPNCWELVQEDVTMTDANRPQLYYRSDYAHSGSYSLLLNYRGVYAMPELSEDIPVKQVKLEMYLRQPKSYYALQVGVWEDDGTFVPVATFNNSGTGLEFVECDFSDYNGNGHRIAFRNISGDNTVRNYSYNYIDDIRLTNVCEEGIVFPYTEDFENRTASTTAATGVEPLCWDLVQEDVTMTDANRPQLYYRSDYAHSGNYSLLLNYRGVYAMPYLSWDMEEFTLDRVKLEMYVRQPKAYYQLEVGVWDDEEGIFIPVHRINNTTTGVEKVTVDFTGYDGWARRIAFRNVLADGYSYNYSYNYIDDITLTEIPYEDCSIHELPYTEKFDSYTTLTTAETGMRPRCWGVVQEDATLTNATMPQIYYNSNYATSGSYTLRMKNRCVYAMPWLDVDRSVSELTMTFKLRQPKAIYRLQVGVLDENWNFEVVKTINNASTETEDVTVDFSGYTGNGYRIAFRNTLGSGSTLDYSINYIDDIVLDYTPAPCGISELPYTENFDDYTQSTTAETGVQPRCWEVTHEDVALTNATKPQVYYNAAYATSGSYTLRMKNRCVYALPELNVDQSVNELTMTFKLRQPKAVYRLQVGVVDAQGNFTSVKTINNSSTETEDITVDFANYTGNGRRIAFRNTVSSSSTLEYSVNYIDNITLDITPAACGIFELPYSENFDDYTQSTTAETGVQPRCWEVTHEDVALTNATKPQVYYNATYATSGSYTLRMKNRCVYALPELNVDQSVNELTMTFRLRQPKAVYRLQVGVVDAQGNFTSVKTINNSSTETEDITVDFANYTGNGRRIAFRNTVSSSSMLEYSVNYIDNIVLDLTPASCDISNLPYAENFDSYTQSTTAETGVQPNCWEVITEEVALTNATKPQVYYNAAYATSGSYTLRMKNRCVYAMPELSTNDPVSSLTMTFSLRQPKAVYRLQVGVVDAQGNFTSVKTINNASTNMEDITVDFANYTGNGRRIAFRNTVSSSSTLDYSVNYIDDITLVRTVNNKSTEVTDATAVDALAADCDQVDVVVYPNPTKDVVNVQCTMNNAQCSGIEIVDVYGKVVRTVGTRFIASADSPASAQSPVQINVSGLAAGMYFVRVTTDRGVVTKPFVKR